MSLADKLQEEKNKDALTIRKIRDIIRASHDVFIKPPGRRVYFLGEMQDVPDSLLDVPILEISTQVFHNDDEKAIKRYNSELGFWISAIPEWDKRVDNEEGYNFEPLDFTVNDGE